MKIYGFFYFSGTGNTQKIVSILKEKLEKYGDFVEIFEIDKILKDNIEIDYDKYDRILIGYPIYGLNAPQIIYDFVKRLPIVKRLPKNKNKDTIILETAGDFISVNRGACYAIKRILDKKGYSVGYKTILAMPSNFFIQYPLDFSTQLYKASLRKIAAIAEELNKDVKREIKFSFFEQISAFIGKIEHKGSVFFGISLTNTNECSFCNLCVKSCPVDNLYFENGKLKGRYKCIFCMKCVYKCPKNAIKSKYMSFVILKEGYDLDKIIKNVSERDFVTKDTKKGYYKHFFEYINSDKIY